MITLHIQFSECSEACFLFQNEAGNLFEHCDKDLPSIGATIETI